MGSDDERRRRKKRKMTFDLPAFLSLLTRFKSLSPTFLSAHHPKQIRYKLCPRD